MAETLTVVVGHAEHQQRFGSLLAEGVRQHGLPVVEVNRLSDVRTHNVACWSWHGGSALHQRGHNVLVLERGYLGDRFEWTSLGWNGLNGRAYAPTPDDPSRFNQHFGHLLKPWNPAGDYVLLIGQVPHDAALGGRSLSPWYRTTARDAASLWGLPVRFRPHPNAVRLGLSEVVPGVPTLDGELSHALAGARVVVTFNSNTGVEALLAGKPTIAFDEGSMALPAAATHLVDTPDEPDYPISRHCWAGHIAWRQWTPEELRNGTAWNTVGLPLGKTARLAGHNVR